MHVNHPVNPFDTPTETVAADSLVRAHAAHIVRNPPPPVVLTPPVDFAAIEEILAALSAEIARQKARTAAVSATPKSVDDLIAEALSR